MRRNPKPRTGWRCLARVLLMLRTRVTRIFLLVFSAMVCQDLFYRLAALGGNLFRRHHRLQALHGGPHKVDGVVDPMLLARTSWTPTASNTAPTGPPAITPVPSEAGC